MSDAEFVPLTQPRGAVIDPLIFAFAEGDLLLDGSALPPHAAIGGAFADALCIGEIDGKACFAVDLPADAIPANLRRIGLRAAHAEIGEMLFGIAGRAAQVLTWDRDHRFCGRCGTPTTSDPGERARRCPNCKLSVYPRISPVIMVLIHRGNELLLLGRAHRFPSGTFSALAGFCEAGETLEQTLVREVREEVGVEVDDIRYFGSQSWPFPQSLMIAFTARYAGGDVVPDGVEIAEAKWFPADALPSLPGGISIAFRLITTVAARLRAGQPPA
jgi:NAD+ diphosphatase